MKRDFSKPLLECVKSMDLARIAIWAFDFDSAKKAVLKCQGLLESYSEEFQGCLNALNGVRKEFKRESRIDRRLAIGDYIRKSKLDTDLLAGGALRTIVRRYVTFLNDWEEQGIQYPLTQVDDSGYRYILVPMGTDKFEFRAYRRPQTKLGNLINSIEWVRKQLHELSPGANMKMLDDLSNKQEGELPCTRLRFFLPNAAADYFFFDDGTVRGDIMGDEDSASKLNIVVLALLRKQETDLN